MTRKRILSLALSGSLLAGLLAAPSAYAASCIYLPASCNINSPFGERVHPIKKTAKFHKGIDLPCGLNTPVKAAADGTVFLSSTSATAGNWIKLRSGAIETVYMHNSKNIARIGDAVQAGQSIALLGSTGASTGPHVHFETLVNGNYVNPLSLLCSGSPPPIVADGRDTPSGEPGTYSWEVRSGLDVGFWDLLSDLVASRALNPSYAEEVGTLSGTRLYQELNYLEGVGVRVAQERQAAKARIARNQSILSILRSEESKLPVIDAQRTAAIQSATK